MSHIYDYGYGLLNVQEDRDLTRAAAERSFQLQALPQRPRVTDRIQGSLSRLRRLVTLATGGAARVRRAEA